MAHLLKKPIMNKESRGAILISGLYLLISTFWILASDLLTMRLIHDPVTLTRISVIKGWGFTLITTLLLFLLIRHYARSIQANQKYLQLIADSLPAALAYLDNDLVYRFNNRGYEQWVGFPRDKIYGLQPADVLGQAVYEHNKTYIERALGGETITFETRIPKANGQVRQTEITYIPNVQPNGQVQGLVVVAVDIEDRKRSEEALRASEARYRLLAENMADVVWLLDPAEMRFTYMSPSVERLRGYTPEEVMAQTLAEVITPESLAMIEAGLSPRLERFLAGDQTARTQSHEVEQYRRDGSTVWTEVVTTLIAPAGGIKILGVTREITERKRTEQELREREAMYRAVIETSSDGFCIMDLQGQILEVNQAYIQRSGYSRDELLALRLSNLTMHEPATRLADQSAAAVAHGSYIYETRQRCKDGAPWQVEVNISYWPIHGGRLFAFLRDIGRRKRSEALLRTRLRLSEMALNAPSNALLLYALDQAELFTGSRIGFFHSIDEDQKNLTLQLWSTRTLQEYCQVEDPKMHYPVEEAGIWTDCLLTGAAVICNDYDSVAHKKGTPEGHASLTRMLTTPVLRNGIAVGIMGVGNKSSDYIAEDVEILQELASIVMDMVARKQAEEAAARYAAELEQRVAERTADLRRANAELEQASRAKDEFLASVSHELRTPLNAILTLTESLGEGAYDPLSERQLKPLHTIAESGYHLLNLINDLLDLSKIEAGKLELQVSWVELEPLCQASLRLVRQQAQNKNLGMAFYIDPGFTSIQADPRRLKQMLVNLLGNAVKFTPPGGEIGLEVRRDQEAGAVRLTVWDTGIGVTVEDARRLFQPFAQVDSGLSRQYGGTGLGLSLVYRMAEMHGGGVSLESTPGHGSRFAISLPWESTVSDLPGTRPLHPLRVPEIHWAVIVTAAETLAEQLKRYLGEIGAKVLHDSTGLELSDRIGEIWEAGGKPDVILLDLQLPGGAWQETQARLQQNRRDRSIPVILLSDIDDSASVKRAGANECLMKPVTRQRLHEALWKTLHKSNVEVMVDRRMPLVLIAEDNPANRAAYADYLTSRGYQVTITSNGAETIERALETVPGVILMDVQLPEINGLEVTRRLRSDRRCAAIPIIAISALDIAGDRERCLETGMNAYLTKPLNRKTLTTAIETLLAGKTV